MTVESYLKYNLALAPVRTRSSACRVAILAGLMLSAVTGPAKADAYGDLPAADRTFIDKLCLPIQYQEGATAFRRCVIEQANASTALQDPTQTQLTFDEQFAIQQFCRSSGDVRSDSYIRCTADQLNSVQGVPATDLSTISDDENYALQQSCYATQMASGVRAYRECLNTALRDLATVPKPDLSSLSILDKNALQLRCSANHDDATSYRSCLLEAMDGAVIQTASAAEQTPADAITLPVVETVLPENAALVVDAAPELPLVQESTFIDQAELTEQVETQATLAPPAVPNVSPELTNADDELIPIADNTAIASDTSDTDEFVEDVGDTGQGIWARLQSSISDLSGMNRLVMLAALALPLCLVGFWLLMRGRNQEASYRPASYNDSLTDRSESSHQHFNQASQPAGYPTPIDTQNFAEQVDQLFAQDTPAETWQTAPTRLVEPLDIPGLKKEVQLSVASENIDLDLDIEKHPKVHQAADRGRIAVWLEEQEPAERLSLAIEFMIYWMAYTDERYEPELKQKIFTLTDPDKHELIKRWVFKQDTQAFAAITRWLQSHASDAQKEQILRLLMALLVSENALTPTQNTLLKFLADVFGIGDENLNVLYEDGFEQSMPQLPRVDKPLWWKHQSTDNIDRWDARAISRQSKQTQFRIKLGLPLTGDLDPEQVLAHYQRAAYRCNSERLDLLTQRERMLVDKQLEKFALAKEGLREELV